MKRYEISNASSYFYMPGEKVYAYADIELKEKIDAVSLKRAAELLLKRFPFFAVRQGVSKEGDRYVLEENTLPFPVTEKDGFVTPGTDDANGYLFTLSFFDRHLLVDMFHGMTDGMGFVILLRTLIMTYFELKEGRSFKCENVKSVFDAPDPDEWKDPMNSIRTVNREFPVKKQKSFSFGSDSINPENVRLYRFSVPEQVLVDYAKRNEGGVSGAIALTLARAIDCIEIDNELPLKIACPMDMRKMLGCENTVRNCTKSASYLHSAALRRMSNKDQLSVLKGQMMIQTSEEYQIPRYEKDKRELDYLNSLPTIDAKKKLFSEIKLKNDPIVSYLGRFDMGELNDRIENVAIYGKVGGKAGIQSVCLCFRGRCFINASYNLKSESYIKMFANEMRDFSHDCSEIMRIEYDTPLRERII